MAKLQTFVNNVNDFAKEVGKDIKDLRGKQNTIINDTQTATDKTWSSKKTKDELDKKVDKVSGKQLSDQNFTKAEKDKLAGLESSKFKGLYASLSALTTAQPTGSAGDYADVDTAGTDVVRYIYDVSDKKWVPQQSGTPITAAQIKQMYESNPDTNAYTTTEKNKLADIEAGAQKNEVNSVNGKKGAVVLAKVDVGLGSVQNYGMASTAEAQAGTTTQKYATPRNIEEYVDGQVGDINPLSLYNTAAGNV